MQLCLLRQEERTAGEEAASLSAGQQRTRCWAARDACARVGGAWDLGPPRLSPHKLSGTAQTIAVTEPALL